MEFSGRLVSFPLGDILQWAHHDRRTGALVVRRSGCEKRIFLSEGEIVACFSDDAAEFFGQHLLVQGLVDETRLIQALTCCQEQGVMLGRALEQLGILSRRQVLDALRQHVEDQVCDVFLWKSGVFYFASESLPADQGLPEPIPAVQLAMEGSRWVDELERIRRVFVHDNIVLMRGRRPPGEPSALERRILAEVDGKLPLSELYNEVRGSYFRFLQGAYRLAVSEALDINEVGDQADSHSTEIRLADLLIEQVIEEQSAFLRHHLAVPFDAFERLVPVWVRLPAEDEDQRLPAAARSFQARIDGEASLGALLGGEPTEERGRQMDRVVVLLRRGALALLPAPLSELEREAEKAGLEPARRWWSRVLAERPPA